MATLGAPDFDAALEIIRDCDRAADLPEFRRRVLAVADLMPADSVAYNEADVVAGTITAEIRPPWMYEPRWRDAFARRSHEHPIIAHMAETGDLTPITISDLMSEEEFHSTGLYREFFGPLGAEDQIAFGLPSSPRMVLGVSLNRSERGFSAEERTILALVAPHLGEAYLAARARTVVAAGVEAAPAGEQLIVLDADDRVTALVGDPATLLGKLGTALAPGEPLPAELAGRIASRSDEAHGWYAGHRYFSVETGGKPVSVRSFAGEFPDAIRILEIREEKDALGPDLAAELQITPREAEVANLLARGLSDQLIAERLTISPHTVKRHVEQIYAKLGVGSRWEALALLLVPAPVVGEPK